MMKQWILAVSCALAAGCTATTGTGNIGLSQLERENYQHASRRLPMTFVQIQRAVFRHQEVCGGEVKFAVDGTQANYARITKPYRPGATGLSETLVLGLTMMVDLSTKAEVFSYYEPSKAQINSLYNIVLKPELCPGQEGAEDWIDIEKEEEEESGLGGSEPGIRIL